MSGFLIEDLADCPQHITIISQWMWDEWDQSRGWTLEDSIKESQSWCQRGAIPWAVVAVDGNQPLGVMCLHPRDLEERPDLFPWMACQYVVPEARGRGVALALSEALEERAKSLDFKSLYMWTEHNPAVYRRYGYRSLFSTQWHQRAIVVLGKNLK
jgi:GNAT superfamily N-acetyltransferase